MWQPDEDGEYFVDRDPRFFPSILNYLRMLKSNTNPEFRIGFLNNHEKRSLYEEVDFYQIESLKQRLMKAFNWQSDSITKRPLFDGSPTSINSISEQQNTHDQPSPSLGARIIRLVNETDISITSAVPFEWRLV